MLSFMNDKLLVSRIGLSLSQLFIFSREGDVHISTVRADRDDKLWDASWTPHGNIIYTAWNNKTVVVMSESGEVISRTSMPAPRYLFVSKDDIIYLADWDIGVLQSTDDGVNWTVVFKPKNSHLKFFTKNYNCRQVVKVPYDNSEDFWTLGQCSSECYLRIYSIDKKCSDASRVTWKDISLPLIDGKHINLLYSKLSYDGDMNIFLTDHDNKSVHVLLANGQYHCQLLSSDHIKNHPYGLTLDRQRRLLYVGQGESVVNAFKLIPEGNGIIDMWLNNQVQE